ncbi:hypothetical protein BD410DRAFT_792874 [Rickenella mellea]|uniref:Peptidase C14 caspase domain-containing protein n=1 Tax=Rickenella mellea TaxID=50990 RepID=A0A4Y7PUZ9_9AGAM|nr:hypothetical protein BD410DRAFT_792874 [Rickenella mellea]
MEDLVKDARPGDHLVFAFSGHGSQTENYDGTELDGKDELIWPCDVEYDGYEDENDQPVMSNYIKDDELKEILVDSLPQGVHFTAILDACHSGTGLDLPNEFSDESVSSILSPISPSQDPQSVFAAGIPSVKAKGLGPLNMNYAMHGTAEDDIPRFCNTPDSPAFDLPSTMAVLETRSVTSWSACSDRQIVLENGKGGILVQAFAKELPTFIEANGRHPTHRELLERLSQALLKSAREARRKLLESIECPKPQLGGLRKIEVILDEEFTF